jgi:hypothetical protein
MVLNDYKANPQPPLSFLQSVRPNCLCFVGAFQTDFKRRRTSAKSGKQILFDFVKTMLVKLLSNMIMNAILQPDHVPLLEKTLKAGRERWKLPCFCDNCIPAAFR